MGFFKSSPTRFVVGMTFGLLFAIALFHLVDTTAAIILLLYLLYEGYTFVNPFPNDTLSEVVVEGSKERPYLIMFLCLPLGYAVGKGWLGDPITVARGLAIGTVLGHWFWRLTVPSDKGE